MGACRLKNLIEIYKEINKDSLFIFLSSKYVKVARLAIQQNSINIKVIKESKRKNQKKITLLS